MLNLSKYFEEEQEKKERYRLSYEENFKLLIILLAMINKNKNRKKTIKSYKKEYELMTKNEKKLAMGVFCKKFRLAEKLNIWMKETGIKITTITND